MAADWRPIFPQFIIPFYLKVNLWTMFPRCLPIIGTYLHRFLRVYVNAWVLEEHAAGCCCYQHHWTECKVIGDNEFIVGWTKINKRRTLFSVCSNFGSRIFSSPFNSRSLQSASQLVTPLQPTDISMINRCLLIDIAQQQSSELSVIDTKKKKRSLANLHTTVEAKIALSIYSHFN